MTLQFPHARLLIHNLLADEHISGAEAIARGACEYGVISQQDSDSAESSEMRQAIINCDCCEAAHCVLRQYFRSKDTNAEGSLEAAWKSLMRRVDRYVKNASKTPMIEPELNCQQTCNNLAPVVFDLLLQELRRYS